MKLKKPKQFRTIGTAVSLALLLGMGTVNAVGNGNENGKSNSPDQDKELYGASIGVSSTCALDETKTVLEVKTTITDKSSGDTPVVFTPDMSFANFYEKQRRGNSTGLLSTSEKFTPTLSGTNDTDLDLCEVVGDMDSNTVSLNAKVFIHVANSKGGTYYGSKCVATDEYPKVTIHYGDLVEDCK